MMDTQPDIPLNPKPKHPKWTLKLTKPSFAGEELHSNGHVSQQLLGFVLERSPPSPFEVGQGFGASSKEEGKHKQLRDSCSRRVSCYLCRVCRTGWRVCPKP